MSWLFYKRGTILPYLADVVLTGISQQPLHPLGIKHPKTFYINEGEKLYWAWEENDLKKMWRRLLILFKSPQKVKAYFKKLDKNIAVALGEAAKVKKLNLQKISNSGLLTIFKDLEKAITPAHFTMNSEIDVIDLYFENYLRSQIISKLPKLSPSQADEIYSALTAQVSPTYVNKQEVVVLRAALSKNFSDKMARNIYDNFWWTNLGWENMDPHTLAYFKSLIKKQAKKKNLRQSLDHALNFTTDNRRRRQKYLAKYKLGADIKYWLWICDKYIYYHDRRKEVQVKTSYSFYLILLEVARRFNLLADDLVWLWHRDVKNILSGQAVNSREIEKRKKGIAAIVYLNKFTVWSGQAAISLRQKNVKEEKSRPSEFRGVGVFNKIVRGRVKVCAGFKEAAVKIKKGDILVCPMTTPEYVPSMKKTKAIITDEGGITCHAAIIARELKIPCIVGTKIATQVLQDNDLVEVDAGQGIIRIIK